jgi:hypothetical protein
MDESTYIKERLEEQIKWYSNSSAINKRFYMSFKITEIILAAIIPFLSGIIDDFPFLKYVIGIIGILIAILGALQIINKYQEKWISYRTTSETLKHEKFLYTTQSGFYNKINENAFSDFVIRVESLISKENTDWNNMIAKTDFKKDQGSTDDTGPMRK